MVIAVNKFIPEKPMKNHTVRFTCLAIFLTFTLISTAGVQEKKEGKDQSVKPRTIVLEKGDQAPTDFVHRVNPQGMTDKINKFLEDAPKKHKIKAEVGTFYNQNSGNYNHRIERMIVLGPDGKKDGIEWDYGGAGESVNLKRKVPWKEGKRHGTEKVFARAKGQGRYVRKKIPWKNGTISGVKKVFHPSGTVMAKIPYKNGKQNGKSKSFNKDGKLTQVVPYKNGKRHGKMIYYWSGTDQKKKVVPCRNGKVNGTAKLYYKDGTLKAEMPFKNDVLHGIVKRYNEKGELDRKRFWIEGEQVPEGVFKDKYKE